MIQSFEPTGTLEGLKSAIADVTNNNETKGLLILSADDNGFTPNVIDPLLQEISLPLFGGIFPQIIYGSQKFRRGSIVIGFTTDINIQFISELSSSTTQFDEIIDERIPNTGDAKTMFVIVDGYSTRVSSLIESLFNIFGLELNYIGGGAGSINPVKIDLNQMPCLLTNHGIKKDGAILALADIESGIGVSHGWDIILSGPHKVTESEGNVLKTIDWRPAFEVYKEVIEINSEHSITEENFFEIAKSYPFGITKMESESIIRDPFAVNENNGLIFNVEIPQESFVNILTGDVRSLINAAENAYLESSASFRGKEDKCVLVVDCISRVLFLKELFHKEIAVMSESATSLVGVLSIGEIANSGQDYLELYNKTCVVGTLGY